MRDSTFRVVLIGGSAGSLPVLRKLFETLPADCGLACVVIQHLSPDHESHLSSLVAKWTRMPVQKIYDGCRLEAGHVYVNVPGRYLRIDDDVLRFVLPTRSDDRHHPIDYLGRSLAQCAGPDAALVVLSGTGSDGTVAAGIIKEAKGLVVVQDPASAAFGDMPASVIAEDLADLSLAPGEIATAICSFGRREQFDRLLKASGDELLAAKTFDKILARVREYAGRDMEVYRQTTLRRRIMRRMGLRNVPDLNGYMHMIEDDPVELDQLARDMLIGVTAFFRDSDAFDTLETAVLPELCARAMPQQPVRVWVAGCSTGEEAYSVVMSLIDRFAAQDQEPQIRVFATDVDDAALAVARAGVYGHEALAPVSRERIQRYFEPEGDKLRVVKLVREAIVFAAHNLTSDPPFSKLDLVVCRNVLIYLNARTQKKLLGLFHFVLNPGGYLFLGSAENIGSVGRHFQTLSKQWRIFQCTDTAPRRSPQLPITTRWATRHESGGMPGDTGQLAGDERVYRKVIDAYGPCQILIDSQSRLLYVSGKVSPYLTIPSGQVSLDLFKIATPVLSLPLRSVVGEARKRQAKASVSVVPDKQAQTGGLGGVRIEVTPVEAADGPGLLLVSIATECALAAARSMVGASGDDWVVKQLSQELSATRDDLRRTIEQSRASGEEMRAANEEIMAMNEELQSANEEMESSKEELQSLNEELATSNANLDAKIIEAEALNADLSNLLDSTETATLLLDEHFRIRRFTPACTRLMRLLDSDTGRSIHDVVRLFADPALDDDSRKVMWGGDVPDSEVHDGLGRWYLRRILPYRNLEGMARGIVLSFIDITSRKRADELLEKRANKLQWQANLLARSAPVLARDLDDRVIFWNRGAEELYGWTEQEAIGSVIHDLLKTRFKVPLASIKAVMQSRFRWKGEVEHVTKNGEKVVVDSQWTAYRDNAGEVLAVVEVNNDITERKLAQLALHENEAMFHTMVDWTFNWEYWLGPDGAIVYMTPSAERITGYSVDEFEASPSLIDLIVCEEDLHRWKRSLQYQFGSDREDVQMLELRITRKNGERRWVNHICRPVFGDGGEDLGRRVTVRDITEQKQAEGQIRELAYYDPLTRLPNRRLLLDRLGQALTSSERNRQFGALLMIDLDYFKQLNDTLGHDIGDRLLVEAAQRLTAEVRHQDSVSRLGGDEFVVLLEGLGRDEREAAAHAGEVAEKIRCAFAQPYELDGTAIEHYHSASIGITLFLGTETSVKVLLKQADVALYQAKDAGRDIARFFNHDMQEAIDARAAMQVALRGALANGEFSLFYQPQLNSEGRMVGAEALIRWLKPGEGLMSPAYFIPLAEETGLIVQIGKWVIDTALQQVKSWSADPRCADLCLSVNVSARQFLHPEFVNQVRQSIVDSAADPAKLKMELTESVLLGSLDEAIDRMHELSRLGVRFSLDDFGTGYSSLSYLKCLPLDELKIDQSFVRDVPEDANDAAIVRAIIAMGRSLGLQVIAEGVETEAQREFLIENDCTVFQGYLFAKPMAVEQLMHG